MELVKVTLKKTGKVIEVLPSEVKGLKKAGVLKESKIENVTKEEKGTGETKEEKETGQTKSAQEQGEANERLFPKPNRPVDISSRNIKGHSPKKVR